MAQISIADKREETELLKEYIVMEKEKLNDGMKAFQEDKDKYEKYKIDLQQKQLQTEEAVRDVAKQCEKLLAEISQLKKEEATDISQESKFNEELQAFKQHKKLLDLLAISAKKKQPEPQRKGKPATTALQGDDEQASRGEGTFLTQD